MTTKVLLTGATGFIGKALGPRLEAAGYEVVHASRRPRARDGRWVQLDLDRPETLPSALAGCEATFYLVHGMAEGTGYAEREAQAALRFRDAAAAAGVQRIVYLGGVDPNGASSEHLASRIETGRILRSGPVLTVELRAAMVAGPGSTSWQIVEDLARFPILPAPPWLSRRSWPVDVNDISAALMASLTLSLERSVWLDAPGPERVSHGELLQRVARALGRPRIRMFPCPAVPASVGAFGLGLLTRADPVVAQELMLGLETDLEPSGPRIWELMPDFVRTPLQDTLQRCVRAPTASSH